MRFLFLSVLLTFVSCASQDQTSARNLAREALNKEIIFDFDLDGSMDSVALVTDKKNKQYEVVQVNLSGTVLKNGKIADKHANPGSSVQILQNGSFQIVVDHSGVGNTVLMKTYTFTFDKEFILSGYALSISDRNNVEFGGTCDLDLIAGKGVLMKSEASKKNVKFKKKKIPFSEVTSGLEFDECKF